MSELQLISNHNTTETIELQTFDLPQNYSILINKLEQLALGLDSAFNNLSVDRKDFEFALSEDANAVEDLFGEPIAAGRAPPPHAHPHGLGGGEVEFSRVVSDIWIGVILTLLIVSVIFFICACFLYHKFQQWKNTNRNNPNEPIEICRRYPSDFEVESLPSYTIVSGLPTYDDALEEFRKAGIILTPSMPIIKIFDSDAKDAHIISMENALNDVTNVAQHGGASSIHSGDNISLSSTCTCGANGGVGGGGGIPVTPNNSTMNLYMPHCTASATTQIIELTPEQLATLSQKRLSLQIAFSGGVRRNSRPRIDLYRAANRNNHLRSRALSSVGLEGGAFPQIHRSTSSHSLSLERNLQQQHYLQQHRGSLC